MTTEQLEQALSNTQIADVQRYNELIFYIKKLEDGKISLPTFQQLEKRVEVLEDIRKVQIEINTKFLKLSEELKKSEKPIDKPKARWSFWY